MSDIYSALLQQGINPSGWTTGYTPRPAVMPPAGALNVGRVGGLNPRPGIVVPPTPTPVLGGSGLVNVGRVGGLNPRPGVVVPPAPTILPRIPSRYGTPGIMPPAAAPRINWLQLLGLNS